MFVDVSLNIIFHPGVSRVSDLTDRSLPSLMSTPAYQAFCRVELAQPYELLDELRSIAPVHWSPILQAWVITSYEGVMAALRHPQLANDRSEINARGIPAPSFPSTNRSSPTSATGSASPTRPSTRACASSPAAC